MLVEPATGHGLLKMSTLDGSTRRLIKETYFVAGAAISPDAAHIAWLGGFGTVDAGIWLIGIDGEGPHRILAAQNGVEPTTIAWSPTSQRLAFTLLRGSGDQSQGVSVQSCDHDGGRCSVILSDPKLMSMEGPTDIVWSSDNRILYRRLDAVRLHDDFWSIPVDPASGRVTGSPTASGSNNLARAVWPHPEDASGAACRCFSPLDLAVIAMCLLVLAWLLTRSPQQ